MKIDIKTGLVSEVRQTLTPNTSYKIDPRYLIIHFTAGGAASGSISWLCNQQSKASAHFVIDRDGTITQLVPLNQMAWHAGKSKYKKLDGLNSYSFGIEIANWGPLNKLPDDSFTPVGDPKQKVRIPSEKVYTGKHKDKQTVYSYWEIYPEVQILALENLTKTICENYKLEAILGHEDVAPFRKCDPGPAFPWQDYKKNILSDTLLLSKVDFPTIK